MSCEYKKCSKCGYHKPLDEFYKIYSKSEERHRVTSWCKECTKEDRKDEYYNRGGKARISQYAETERGKETRQQANDRYNQSEKGKATRKAYY